MELRYLHNLLYKFILTILIIIGISFSISTNVYADCDCAEGWICPGGQCRYLGGFPHCDVACVPASADNPDFAIPNYATIGETNFNFMGWASGTSRIGAIVTAFLPYIFVFAGIALFGYLLYGGFTLATSFGSPKAILEAWLIVFRAVVGFILIFTSYWLMRIVEIVFGLNILG